MVFVAAIIVIAPSLALLFVLDQRDRLSGYGVGSDLEQDSPHGATADGGSSPVGSEGGGLEATISVAHPSRSRLPASHLRPATMDLL